MDANRRDKRMRAQNRVGQLKGFYIHATVYLLVNLFIITTSVMARMGNGESFSEAFFNFGTFATAVFWGVGLAFHAARVFGYSPFFSKDWEARQIQKYMEEDRREEERLSKW